jgi:hypothetical protein
VGLAGKEIKRWRIALDSLGPDDDDVGHLVNWPMVMQTRKDPSASVDGGFSHVIVWIMCPLLLERPGGSIFSARGRSWKAEYTVSGIGMFGFVSGHDF